MRKHLRTIAALVLSLCMVFNFSVFAETQDKTVGSEETIQIEDLVVAYDSKQNEIDIDSVDEDSYGGYIFRLKDSISTAQINSVEKEVNKIDDEDKVKRIYGDFFYSADSLETISDVVDPEMIEYIEPDYYQELYAYSTNDTYYSYNAKAYNLVNAPAVWELGMTGAGKNGNKTPVVGVIDSGIAGFNSSYSYYPKHEDINYNNIPLSWKTNALKYWFDENGHGTFVTGQIAAITNNRKGANGFVPDVTIIPGKVFDASGRGLSSYSMNMLDSFANEEKDYPIDVVNMSLGGTGYQSSYQEVVNDATRKGIIIVAAAGNEADEGNPISYPASYDNVISVAATDTNGNHAYYSNYNSYVDVCAPGTFAGPHCEARNAYYEMSGTSMACPVVASLAAMAKSLNNSITTTQFMNILKSTCKDLGTSGRDNYYGYGMVDFKKVYDKLAPACNHSYKWYVTKKADMDEDGLREYKCEKCGNVADSVVIPYIETLELSKESFSYTGKTIKPKLIVEDGEGDTISSSYYTTSVNKTAKSVGKYVMTVKFNTKYQGTYNLSFKINPTGTTISKLTKGSKSCKVAWKKKTTQVTGYQIQYSSDSSYDNAKIKTISKNKTTSVKITGLASGSKYYFRIRTYKTSNGVKYYSGWSANKSVTVK